MIVHSSNHYVVANKLTNMSSLPHAYNKHSPMLSFWIVLHPITDSENNNRKLYNVSLVQIEFTLDSEVLNVLLIQKKLPIICTCTLYYAPMTRKNNYNILILQHLCCTIHDLVSAQ